MNTATLRAACGGTVLLPGDTAYAASVRGWNTSVVLRPEVMVAATSVQDVQVAIRFAAAQRLKLLARGTGHGVAPTAEPHVLLLTGGMNAVSVDASRQTARIGAGATWGEVLAMTAAHGLAPLLGSSPTVGVVGYTLGGGLGWLARAFGPAVDSVIGIDVVTAAGEVLQLNDEGHAALLWALRGAGGGFAVVTAMEVQLVPVASVFGGMLVYPLASAPELFRHYREWTAALPDTFTTSLAIGELPDRVVIAGSAGDRRVLMLRGVFAGAAADGARHLAPIIDWRRPLVDTFATMPFSRITSISNDPEEPSPALTVGGQTFTTLADALLDTLAASAVAADAPFIEVELRHIHTTARPAVASCYPHRDARYVLDVVAAAPTDAHAANVRRHAAVLRHELAPHASGCFLNLADDARAADCFEPSTLARLLAVKQRYDPEALLISGFSIASPGR